LCITAGSVGFGPCKIGNIPYLSTVTVVTALPAPALQFVTVAPAGLPVMDQVFDPEFWLGASAYTNSVAARLKEKVPQTAPPTPALAVGF